MEQFYGLQLVSIVAWFLILAKQSFDKFHKGLDGQKKEMQDSYQKIKQLSSMLPLDTFRLQYYVSIAYCSIMLAWAALNMLMIYEAMPLTKYGDKTALAAFFMFLVWAANAYSNAETVELIKKIMNRRTPRDLWDIMMRYCLIHSKGNILSRNLKYITTFVAWSGILVTLSVI